MQVAFIGKQGFDPYARLRATRAVIGTFPCSAGAIVDPVLPFSTEQKWSKNMKDWIAIVEFSIFEDLVISISRHMSMQ
jgi:hypothetical protein